MQRSWVRKKLRNAAGLYFSALSSPIVALFPEERWYRAASLCGAAHLPLIRLLELADLFSYRRDIRQWTLRRTLVRARILEICLSRLHARQRPFPVPIAVQGMELVRQAQARGGLVICSRHMYFNLLQLRALMEARLQVTPIAIVAEPPGGLRDVSVWGLGERMPSIAANAGTLLKVRGILGHGGTLAILLDEGVRKPANCNILRLVSQIKAEILLSTIELQPNGEIRLDVFNAPDPHCQTEESIQANLAALETAWKRVLRIETAQEPCSTPVIAERPITTSSQPESLGQAT